jgi:dihydroorotase
MAEGYDADLTVVDLKAKRTLRHEDMLSRCGWTPFDEMTVMGFPMLTIIRGATVMREGEITLPARGQPVRFQDALTPSGV